MNCCIKRDTEEIAFENARTPKIPRPPNAFMLYANENRKTMAQMYPAESNKEISKRLGSCWKSLEMQEKSKYFDRAKLIDLEHKKKYPNYVYNPKEARIRKAMREATRDRSIGASPMLPRPSARWVSAHEEPLLMSPLSSMRNALESPVCFPITPGNGNNQFMSPMSSYNKLERPNPPPPPTSSMHSNYMQPNPLAQLQQHTEMWENYQQEGIRPRSSGNPYMMSDVPSYQSSPSEGPVPLLMEKHPRQTHSVSSTSMSMTPPHSNENVPPDDSVPQEKPIASPESSSLSNSFEQTNKTVESVQPLMESNNMQQQCDQFISSSYPQNLTNNQSRQFDKSMDIKKSPVQMGNNSTRTKSPSNKPLPDFNEAFGSTERGRFQSPPDPRLVPNKGYLDYFLDSNQIKFDDYQI